MLLYIDDVLGRLFEAVAASGLADSTYILLTADNGPGLPKAFLKDKMQRLVSMIRSRFPPAMCQAVGTIEGCKCSLPALNRMVLMPQGLQGRIAGEQQMCSLCCSTAESLGQPAIAKDAC